MTARGHVAVRTCVGCGAVAPQSELVRLVVVDGSVLPDRGARAPGRGAWVHPGPDCIRQAMARRRFHRAFRAAVTVPPDTVDSITEWRRSASES